MAPIEIPERNEMGPGVSSYGGDEAGLLALLADLQGGSVQTSPPELIDLQPEIDQEIGAVDEQLAATRDQESGSLIGDVLGALLGAALGAATDGQRGAIIGAGGAATQSLADRKEKDKLLNEIQASLLKRKQKLQDERRSVAQKKFDIQENRAQKNMDRVARILGRSKVVNNVNTASQLGLTDAQKMDLIGEFSDLKNLTRWHSQVLQEVEGKTAGEIRAALTDKKSKLYNLARRSVKIASAGAKAAGLAPISEEEREAFQQSIGLPPIEFFEALADPLSWTIDGETIARNVNEYFSDVYGAFDTKTQYVDSLFRENTLDAGYAQLKKQARGILEFGDVVRENPNVPVFDTRKFTSTDDLIIGAQKAGIKKGQKFLLVDKNGNTQIKTRGW